MLPLDVTAIIVIILHLRRHYPEGVLKITENIKMDAGPTRTDEKVIIIFWRSVDMIPSGSKNYR